MNITLNRNNSNLLKKMVSISQGRVTSFNGPPPAKNFKKKKSPPPIGNPTAFTSLNYLVRNKE